MHTLLHKNVLRINEHFLIFKFQQKVLMIFEVTYFEVKNATAFVGPSGLQTLSLLTNVSANLTSFEEQICQDAQNLLH